MSASMAVHKHEQIFKEMRTTEFVSITYVLFMSVLCCLGSI